MHDLSLSDLCCSVTCRNYHVFYYLLMGASRDEQEEFHLLKPQDYFYLNQVPLNAPPSLSPIAHIHITLRPRVHKCG